jgi:hypothetical protein
LTVKNRDELTASLSTAVARLEQEDLTTLDFDELRRTLGAAASRMAATDDLTVELAVLRDDYIARITGMLKAVAAVSRREDRIAETLVTVDALPTLSADKLVAAYRTASAQFRDAFPTSFGRLTGSPRRQRRDTLTDYK